MGVPAPTMMTFMPVFGLKPFSVPFDSPMLKVSIPTSSPTSCQREQVYQYTAKEFTQTSSPVTVGL